MLKGSTGTAKMVGNRMYELKFDSKDYKKCIEWYFILNPSSFCLNT